MPGGSAKHPMGVSKTALGEGPQAVFHTLTRIPPAQPSTRQMEEQARGRTSEWKNELSSRRPQDGPQTDPRRSQDPPKLSPNRPKWSKMEPKWHLWGALVRLFGAFVQKTSLALTASLPLGAQSVPNGSKMAPQNGAKMVKKSIKRPIKIWMPFSMAFCSDFHHF